MQPQPAGLQCSAAQHDMLTLSDVIGGVAWCHWRHVITVHACIRTLMRTYDQLQPVLPQKLLHIQQAASASAPQLVR